MSVQTSGAAARQEVSAARRKSAKQGEAMDIMKRLREFIQQSGELRDRKSVV